MSLAYSIEGELVTVVGEVSLGVDEIRATFSKIRSEFESASRVRILIVDSGYEFEPTPEEIQEFVGIWGSLFQDVSVRIAFLIKREIHYGLGRMGAVYAERHGLPLRVFRRRSEAVEWLSEPEPVAL